MWMCGHTSYTQIICLYLTVKSTILIQKRGSASRSGKDLMRPRPGEGITGLISMVDLA